MDTKGAIRSLSCGALLATWATLAGAAEFDGPVVRVLDGDTLEVLNNHHPERIRLSGIGCPENRQAYGQNAKYAASALAFGKDVTIQMHGHDKYTSTLGDVILSDGMNLNQELVKQGWCWWYRKAIDAAQESLYNEHARSPPRPNSMDLETIRRISLARHLFELGNTTLRSSNDLHLFATANLLQDAVEAFLIAVGDHVGAKIDQHTAFDKYFVSINDRIKPKELPFKARLLRLNLIRVAAKHHGIQPARDECNRVAISVREFFDEVSTSLLGVPFATVSALDLLDEGEIKQLLLEAKACRETNDLKGCVINCRKVIFLAVERNYDIAMFKDGEPRGLLDAFSSAPFYARNKEYIDKYVCDPTDFIVLDHSKVDQELLTQGIDTTTFWNIRRLTPEVYRTGDKEWIIQHDFAKLDGGFLADKADYVFSTTVDVLLARQTAKNAVKYKNQGSYQMKLARGNVPVYRKADTI